MKRRYSLALLCAGLAQLAQAQTVENRARTAAQAARAKSSSSEAIQQNYVTPGMSGQPIATVDSTKSFTPTINCQKTASLLQVLVQPSATGDIGTIRVSQDTDFDGSFDRSNTLAQPVSGICANGVISCQPGSWNQCHFFKWDADAAKALKLSEVGMSDLAGCYCVNNSCGTNLVWGNLSEVLKDLGGGMVGALTTVDPRIGVAQAQVSGPVIDYVGAQATACAADPNLGQTAYRSNPAAIQSDAATIAGGNSIFQLVKGSPAGIGKAEQTRSCTITREVVLSSATFEDIVSVSGALQAQYSCGPDCRRYRIGGEGNCSAMLRGSGMCHEVGTYCSSKILGICVQKSKGHCCFNTKLGRIIQEQGRPQLKSFNGIGWSTPKNPMCRGFLRAHANEFALVMFSRSSCGYCRVQWPIIQRFQDEMGWQVTLMDLDRRPELGSRFGVEVTPTTMLIRRGSQQRMIIASGVEAYPALAQMAYQAVRLLSGDIRPEQFMTGAGEEGGFFDALGLGPVSASDPRAQAEQMLGGNLVDRPEPRP